MRKKMIVPFVTGLLAQFAAFSQPAGYFPEKNPWTDKPQLHQMPALFSTSSAVYLQDSRICEYKFEGNDLYQYITTHKLIKVMNDKGIELFNKIFIPSGGKSDLSDLKARVITSSGKVIDIPGDKIKEEEIDGRKYKLFAMEGLDKGSEVEYMFVSKKAPTFFGGEIFQSREVPYVLATMTIISPRHLKFEAKGFNGFTILQDSVTADQRFLYGYTENVKELDDEKYGLREPYLRRVDYKFSYNLDKKADVELYTWKEFARNAYINFTTITDKERKAATKFLNAIGIPENASEEKKIQLIEDYCKNKINADDKLVSEDASNLEAIIKTTNTNTFGICKFMAALFDIAGIRYQLVFPSVRDQLPLDEELENWNRIEETLLYFPGTGQFLQPDAAVMRYPFITPYWSGTRGLFLKGTSIGDVKMGVGKFDTIPMIPFDQHAHNLELSAKFDATSDSLIINSKQILTGYGATGYRPIWAFLTKDKQDEMLKDIVSSVAKSEHIENIQAENTKLTDNWDNKPLVISATIYSADPVDRAGNKILLKIGELIGPQEQMYQEKTRQLPAEMQYPHVLKRRIRFEIPEGYQVKNLKDLDMDIQQKENGEVTLGFVSKHSVTGNMLEVDILETYRNQSYPLSEFETFKKVINASADFNKVVLVLEKK